MTNYNTIKKAVACASAVATLAGCSAHKVDLSSRLYLKSGSQGVSAVPYSGPSNFEDGFNLASEELNGLSRNLRYMSCGSEDVRAIVRNLADKIAKDEKDPNKRIEIALAYLMNPKSLENYFGESDSESGNCIAEIKKEWKNRGSPTLIEPLVKTYSQGNKVPMRDGN